MQTRNSLFGVMFDIDQYGLVETAKCCIGGRHIEADFIGQVVVRRTITLCDDSCAKGTWFVTPNQVVNYFDLAV